MQRQLLQAVILFVLSFSGAIAVAAPSDTTVRSVPGAFDDVKERVVSAIESRGLVINYTARVGDMLERTGKDIGRDRKIYVKAEVIEFCSAAASRATMEADPLNIVFCPYAIAVYVLPAAPGKVYVAYRKPPATGSAPSMKALREVGTLLDGIVREALK